jgi:hypothetical protein
VGVYVVVTVLGGAFVDSLPGVQVTVSHKEDRP